MKKLFHHILIFCLLLSHGGTALFGASPWMLCVGEDGHVGIESPHACCEDDQGASLSAAGDRESCCVDMVIGSIATVAGQNRNHQSDRLISPLTAPHLQHSIVDPRAVIRRIYCVHFLPQSSDIQRLHSVILLV